jgi:hypothetical protein
VQTRPRWQLFKRDFSQLDSIFGLLVECGFEGQQVLQVQEPLFSEQQLEQPELLA